MKTDRVFVLLLVVLLPLSGCFDGGTIDTAEATDDIGDGWINEQGSINDWNLSLSSNQWIEVKSAAGLLEDSGRNITHTYSLTLLETQGWEFKEGFSPIFGGSYTLCIELESDCYIEYPDSNWELTQWSVIYRIHDV